ncbi:nuclear transport factor 2 family protein [Acaryochloris marina]|uniref:SnoaL-like domain-containing protein n=1 Tax=Acaryochloris marina (strain MBIC 11017) TaxID=329726 RepID=B0C0J0_ACAM1|nr:nuclear transport factor 2 family protein [Acaryochloris marina]ABW30783.1 hypothetical protein AM1_5842 [Acaryochloris marina MBIC11017]BDM79541.1 hypothetical protein AM10699_24090 [Acaryochloris marina MBIC10699]
MKQIWKGVLAMTILASTSTHAFATPQDNAQIVTIVESVATLADRGEFSALEHLYDDEVTVDYTSLTGGEVELKSPQALMTQWASVLPGFDVTRHDISNVEVTVDGQKAVATADVIADHYMGNQHWQVQGDYRYELQKEGDIWRITSHRFNFHQESGDRTLFGPASKRAAATPILYLQRQETKQTVLNFLTALEEKDMEKFASVWSMDAVQEMPYAPGNFPKRVVGKQNLIQHYAQWPEISGKTDFTSQLVFYPMRDPKIIFAEWIGKVDIISTGREYNQAYGGLFHVENGKITLFREYFNPIPFTDAFGLDESN